MTRGEDGFTLLELLVAMTLLALLMFVLLGGLRFGARAWERSEASGPGNEEVQRVHDLVAGEIEQSYPLYIPGATPADGRVDFSGDATRVTFLARPPRAFSDAGRARIALERRPDGRWWQLVMVIRPELASADTPSLVEPLLTQLADVRFSYSAAADAPDWRAGWSGRRTLPGLVRLEIAFPAGDARNWPGVIAAPRISADADCVYDAATKSCQGR